MKTNSTITKKKNSVFNGTIHGLFGAIIFMLLSMNVAHAQSNTVNINVNNKPIETVIDEIRKQTDINFIYSNEEIRKCPNVSVSVVDATVIEVLDHCFKNTQFSYTFENNTIIISAKLSENTPVKSTLHKQTIRGKVIDKDSQGPLPYANVVVLNSNPVIGATTDMEGNFVIPNVPIGRQSLSITYVGYEDAVVSEILVGSVKEVVLTIELTESVAALEAFVVTVDKTEALNEMATVSAQSFSVEETQRYAASIGDPARMAQSFAGVATGDDASNEIIIRGNSPNWLLWRLEGIEIPSPNHFVEEGGSAGAVSILSSRMLSTSDFLTGAFPAEYGGALSGVFDIKLRNGNNQKSEYSASIGVLGLDVSAEGPLKKGYEGSYLINYRYATLSLLNIANIQVSENALPNYQDLSFKVNLPTKKAGTFAIWGIGGLSDTDEEYLPDTTAGEKFEYGYSDNTETGMYATGISHNIFLDSKSYIKSVVSNSMTYSSEEFSQMDSLGSMNEDFYDKLKNSAIRMNSFYNRKISKRTTLRTGFILSNINYNYYSQAKDTNQNWVTRLNSDGRTNIYQAYLQGKYKFSDDIVLTMGLHYTNFALSNDNSVEPRAGLMFYMPHRQRLSFGYGRHSKSEHLSTYFVQIENPDGSVTLPNIDLKMTRADHFVVSYEKKIGANVNFKAETYLQLISDLPVADNPDKYWTPIFGGAAPDDTLANIGSGRNIGIELTVQKYFSDGYYFLVNSSIFDSKYKAADGVWRSTKYDIGYINNVVGGKEYKWGDNKVLGLNGKVIWSGGKRLIPINLNESIAEGEGVYQTDALWSTQAADYFRLDLGVKLHFFKSKVQHTVSLDIQNVTNRLNEWVEIYNPETESIVSYPMAGLIPVFTYRIDF